MTKNDLRKSVEELFSSKRVAWSIKCDTCDDSVDRDTGNASVTNDKEEIQKLSAILMENMMDSLKKSYEKGSAASD